MDIISDGQKFLIILAFLGIVFIGDGMINHKVTEQKISPSNTPAVSSSPTPTQIPTITTAPATPTINNTIKSIIRPQGMDDNRNKNLNTDN